MGAKAIIIFICASLLLIACSQTKSLENGQYLFDKATIKINSTVKISKGKKSQLKSELKGLIRPETNSSILGFRFKLWVYNWAGKPSGKGLRYWLKNKVGEPPVLASFPALEKNRAVLQNRLENKGFFQDSVTMDTTSKARKIRVVYTALIGDQYKIRKVTFPGDSSHLSSLLRDLSKKTLLKPGDPYDLDIIKNERVRTETGLQEKGYFYFNPDYLLVVVDSTVGNHQVDMRVVVKRSTPPKALEVYSINEVIIFADYDIHVDTNTMISKGVKLKSYTIIDPGKKFRPDIFNNAFVFKPGDVFNRTDHELSLNRLTNMGVFKFVKVRFEDADSGKNKLNAFYYLTPTEMKSIRFEASGLTKSDNTNGGLLSVNWRNRNFFRGAELFIVNVYGGLESQYLGNGLIVNTKKAGATLNLYIPRIISFFPFRTNSSYMPKTRLELGYEFYNRTTQYQLNSFKTSFGYIWKENVTKEHQLNLITILYIDPTHISPQFQLQLDTNLTLARSIERQFTIGPNYNFNLNTLLKPNTNQNNFYFNSNLDLSANVLGLVSGASIDKGNVKKIFNTPFSQYIRVELDFRHYLSFDKYAVLASRITGGVGYAYGNSNTMPFIKEFFAGGANDLRAFRSRSLGPGSFYAGNRATAFLPDQPGDIKMEMNTELRFRIFSVFRGALFVDAGNIWTVREDSKRPGSQFTPQFLQQIAVGIGGGIRADISILILRVDLGIPVREPFRPQGSRWNFDGNNLVWNFAIGYPF
jgi:outer membrane protein insertion porin family